MTYDHEVTLIGYTLGPEDALGQQVEVPVKTVVLCAEKSISHREFYAAASQGIRPEVTLVVHRYEYGGQKDVEYGGQKMKVIRTYAISPEEIELTCGDIAGS